MYCPWCRAEVGEDMVYCPKCGRQIKTGQPAEPTTPAGAVRPLAPHDVVAGQQPGPPASQWGQPSLQMPLAGTPQPRRGDSGGILRVIGWLDLVIGIGGAIAIALTMVTKTTDFYFFTRQETDPWAIVLAVGVLLQGVLVWALFMWLAKRRR